MNEVTDNGSLPKRSVSPTSLSINKPLKKIPIEQSINRISTGGVSFTSDSVNRESINRISTGNDSIFSRRSTDEMMLSTNYDSPERQLDLPSLSKSIEIIQPFIYEEKITNSLNIPADNINVSMDGITILHSPSKKNNSLWKSASSNALKNSTENMTTQIIENSPSKDYKNSKNTNQLSVTFKLSELRAIFDKCLVIVNDLDDEFDYDQDYSGKDSKDQGNLADMQSLSRYILWKLSCKELSQDILAFHPTSSHGYMRWDDLIQLAKPYILDENDDDIKYKVVRPKSVSPDKYIDLLDSRTIDKETNNIDIQDHFSYNPIKNDTNIIPNESVKKTKSDHSLELAIEVISSVQALQALVDNKIPVTATNTENDHIPIPRISEDIISTREMFSFTTISNTNVLKECENSISHINKDNNLYDYKKESFSLEQDVSIKESSEVIVSNIAPAKPIRERNIKSNLKPLVNETTSINYQTTLQSESNPSIENTLANMTSTNENNHTNFNGTGISLKLHNLARGNTIKSDKSVLKELVLNNSCENPKSVANITPTNCIIQGNIEQLNALKRLNMAVCRSTELVRDKLFQYTPLSITDNISRWNMLLNRREPLSFARSFDVNNCMKYKLGISSNYIKVHDESKKTQKKKVSRQKGNCNFYVPIPMPNDLLSLNHDFPSSQISIHSSEIHSSILEMKTTKGIYKNRYFTMTYESEKNEFYFRIYSKYIVADWGNVGLSMKIEIPIRLISSVIVDKDDTRCFSIRYYYDNSGDNYSTILVPKSEDDTQQIYLRATNSDEKNVWIIWLENIIQYCKKIETDLKNSQLQLEKQFKAQYELEKKNARINS